MRTFLLALALLAGAARAQDVPDSQDHPLLRRYEGSSILGYRRAAFDAVALPLGPPARVDRTWTLPEQRTVEGARTRVLYVSPEGRSSLEVFRNYKQALESAGARVLYACDEAACGPPDVLIKRFLYADPNRLDDRGQVTRLAFSDPLEPHYLLVQLSRPDGDVYVSVFVAREGFDLWKDLTWNRALVLVDVIETRPMEAGKVVVDAEAMARDLQSAGRVALYGVSFETNSTAILPDSEASLQEIAKLLAARPELRLYVVGHTDAVGGLEANLDLSRRRAEAVVSALVSRHKVDPSRLKAAGVGPYAPVAPNASEQGRALNRRVELVPQ